MYNRNLADLDGHVWEMMWMDPSAISRSCDDDTCLAHVLWLWIKYPDPDFRINAYELVDSRTLHSTNRIEATTPT